MYRLSVVVQVGLSGRGRAPDLALPCPVVVQLLERIAEMGGVCSLLLRPQPGTHRTGCEDNVFHQALLVKSDPRVGCHGAGIVEDFGALSGHYGM